MCGQHTLLRRLSGAAESAHHAPGFDSRRHLNFLAHLYLSPPGEDALLGSLLGDFVKGPLEPLPQSPLTRAIALHRKLDLFTDSHPMVLASKARVSAGRRRFAGVMVDLFYDHFLARDWREFHDEPLDAFSRRVYGMLERRFAELPPRLQRMAPHMIAGDWLGSYAEVDAVGEALDRIGTRLRGDNRLYGSADELRAQYAGFEADFRDFMPQALRFCREHPLAR